MPSTPPHADRSGGIPAAAGPPAPNAPAGVALGARDLPQPPASPVAPAAARASRHAPPDTPYPDHVGLWANELAAWVPDRIFDAHVHVGPPELVGPIAPERRLAALSTFMSFPWAELLAACEALFPGKTLAGFIAFPFPQREVDLDRSNEHIIELMQLDSRVKGFLASHPTDTGRALAAFEKAQAASVRFLGVKPYADRLGKSNFDATLPEFVPEDLLEFMDAERLLMMLHTSGMGVGERNVREFLRSVTARFPRIRIILAHMGRYVDPRQFLHFMDSGLLQDCPNLYLDMSSASCTEVYARLLAEPALWDRLLFATDLPFGLITGVERWSDDRGAVFLSRDSYSWSDPKMQEEFADERQNLTYNTYHCIKALKDAMEALRLDDPTAAALKRRIFHDTAAALFT